MSIDAQASNDPGFPGEDLEKAYRAIWQALENGASDRRSPFHTPTLLSNGLDGWPKARTVVLRNVDKALATLRCHTDQRSPKVAELMADGRSGLLAYDPNAKVQIRLEGTGRVEVNGAIADAAWSSSTLWARRCYAAPFDPGAETDIPHGNLPENLTDRQPTEKEAEAGRGNFAVIVLAIDRIDWLYLASSGHHRGRYLRSGDTWSKSWVAP